MDSLSGVKVRPVCREEGNCVLIRYRISRLSLIWIVHASSCSATLPRGHLFRSNSRCARFSQWFEMVRERQEYSRFARFLVCFDLAVDKGVRSRVVAEGQ